MMHNPLDEQLEDARKSLWSNDFLGYKFEMLNLAVLKKHGYGKYITYKNPKDPSQWKRKKGVGVDLIITMLGFVFYIEESFCTHNYPYRQNWFTKCRLPRFSTYKSDNKHIRVLLTNKPQNFSSVTQQAKQNNIIITTLNQLLTRLRKLASIIKHRQSNSILDYTLSDTLDYVYAVDSTSVVGISREQLQSLIQHLSHYVRNHS